MRARHRDHIVDGETSRCGVGEHALDAGVQSTFVLARRVGLAPAGTDGVKETAPR
jgi:hypothetical protein